MSVLELLVAAAVILFMVLFAAYALRLLVYVRGDNEVIRERLRQVTR